MNGWSHVEVLLIYNGVATYFSWENKKLKELKRYVTFIDELKYVHLLIITTKLHGFGSRYNILRKIQDFDS